MANDIKWENLDIDRATIVRLMWWEGSSYDPAGYYTTIKFDEYYYQVLVKADTGEQSP